MTDEAPPPYHRALHRAAVRFRQAILATRPTLSSFQDFPAGSCGDASILLGEYLLGQGFGEWQYVAGERCDWSHGWIEQGDIIVDITADQFDDVNVPVIVTCDQSWHASFTGRGLVATAHAARIKIYDAHTAATLSRAYSAIVSWLATGEGPDSES